MTSLEKAKEHLKIISPKNPVNNIASTTPIWKQILPNLPNMLRSASKSSCHTRVIWTKMTSKREIRESIIDLGKLIAKLVNFVEKKPYLPSGWLPLVLPSGKKNPPPVVIILHGRMTLVRRTMSLIASERNISLVL